MNRSFNPFGNLLRPMRNGHPRGAVLHVPSSKENGTLQRPLECMVVPPRDYCLHA